MKKLVIAIASVALFSLSQVAVADDYAVNYSTTELSSGAGVASLHARIVKTAKQYCPTYSQIRNTKDVQSCVNGVVEDLVSKVNHPILSDYNAGERNQRVAQR